MSEPSKLSQQVVALVLAHVGVRSNPEARHDAAVNVDAHLRELQSRLVQVEKERQEARAAALRQAMLLIQSLPPTSAGAGTFKSNAIAELEAAANQVEKKQ